MKKIILLILAIFTQVVFAQDERVGVGAMLGNPTAANAKYWLNEDHAVDTGVGFTLLSNRSDFSVHSDYLWHSKGVLIFKEQYPLDLYYGAGARMRFSDDIILGLRLPVGLSHRLENSKFELFTEGAPVIDIISRRGIEIHLGVGARYYF